MRSARSLSLLLLVALLATLLSGAWAQSPWAALHQALDTYQYEQAAQLAQKLPAGPQRDLALAEVAVTSRRFDRSFAYTDKLTMPSLPAELHAKMALVRAQQELYSAYPLASERQAAVARWIKDGLRFPGSAHDHARLLLLALEQTRPGDIEQAREAAIQLSEIEDVDPSLFLRSQALLAEREGHFRQATAFWRILARGAADHKQTRAAILYGLEEARTQERAGARDASLAARRSLWQQSLALQDPVAMLESWWPLWGAAAEAEKPALLESAVSASRRLPENVETLAFMGRLAWVLSGDERVAMSKRGQAIAQKLDEPVLELFFLQQWAVQQRSTTEGTAGIARARVRAADLDLRGVSGTWYPTVNRLAQPVPEPTQERRTPASLAAELATESEPQQRANVYNFHLSDAVRNVDPVLAETSFFAALEEAIALPDADRVRSLSNLLSSLTNISSRRASRPNDANPLTRSVVQGLAQKFANQPDLVDAVLESYLNDLRKQGGDPTTSWERLADWLVFLGRPSEAQEILEQALVGIPSGRIASRLRDTLGELRLRGGDPEGLDQMIEARRSFRPWNYSDSVAVGWEAFHIDDYAQAQRWAQQSLEEASEADTEQAISYGAYELLALSLGRQDKVAEGLTVLDQVSARENLKPYDVRRLALARADLLEQDGRGQEAAAILSTVDRLILPAMSVYELNLRRRVAEKMVDSPTLAALQGEIDDFLQSSADAPTVAQWEVALSPQGLPSAWLLPRETANAGFAAVIEGLERLRRRDGRSPGLRRVSASDLKAVMAASRPGEVFVQPLLLEHSLVLIVLSQNQAMLTETFCDPAKLEKAAAELPSRLASPDFNMAVAEPDLRYLSGHLIQPWRAAFPGTTHLRWLGRGEFGKMPLAVLPDGQGRLLDSVDISFLDGSGWNQVKVGEGTSTLLVDGASDLTGSARELAALRRLFPNGSSWTLGDDLQTLKRLASSHGLLHISTHGSVPSSASLGGELGGDEGTLSAFQLAELSLPKTSLAVLGACESNIDAGTGRDNSSLVSALRTAGAGVVVGSVWPLDDQVTAQLFETFYQALRHGDSPQHALTLAQREVARKWPHPYYWAGLRTVTGP